TPIRSSAPDSTASVFVPSLRRQPSGVWQKYSYRRWHGIIGAKNGQVLPKGCSYDHYRFVVPHCISSGAADRATTGLFGADCAPSDQSPASGAPRQDSVGTGDGSYGVRCGASDAPQSRNGTYVASALACPCPQARAD